MASFAYWTVLLASTVTTPRVVFSVSERKRVWAVSSSAWRSRRSSKVYLFEEGRATFESRSKQINIPVEEMQA